MVASFGEVHIDHVPTDFLKQDFQRTSPEWIRAISFLRGESSLQPKLAAEAGEPTNTSPVYRLYQGYRRVRDIGTRDMYMASGSRERIGQRGSAVRENMKCTQGSARASLVSMTTPNGGN